MAKDYASIARSIQRWEDEHGDAALASIAKDREEERKRAARLAYKKWWMELPEAEKALRRQTGQLGLTKFGEQAGLEGYSDPGAHYTGYAQGKPIETKPLGGTAGALEGLKQAGYDLPLVGTGARAAMVAGYGVSGRGFHPEQLISEPEMGRGAQLSRGAEALKTGAGIAGNVGELVAGGHVIKAAPLLFGLHGALSARSRGGDVTDWMARAATRGATGAATGALYGKMVKRTAPFLQNVLGAGIAGGVSGGLGRSAEGIVAEGEPVGTALWAGAKAAPRAALQSALFYAALHGPKLLPKQIKAWQWARGLKKAGKLRPERRFIVMPGVTEQEAIAVFRAYSYLHPTQPGVADYVQVRVVPSGKLGAVHTPEGHVVEHAGMTSPVKVRTTGGATAKGKTGLVIEINAGMAHSSPSELAGKMAHELDHAARILRGKITVGGAPRAEMLADKAEEWAKEINSLKLPPRWDRLAKRVPGTARGEAILSAKFRRLAAKGEPPIGVGRRAAEPFNLGFPRMPEPSAEAAEARGKRPRHLPHMPEPSAEAAEARGKRPLRLLTERTPAETRGEPPPLKIKGAPPVAPPSVPGPPRVTSGRSPLDWLREQWRTAAKAGRTDDAAIWRARYVRALRASAKGPPPPLARSAKAAREGAPSLMTPKQMENMLRAKGGIPEKQKGPASTSQVLNWLARGAKGATAKTAYSTAAVRARAIEMLQQHNGIEDQATATARRTAENLHNDYNKGKPRKQRLTAQHLRDLPYYLEALDPKLAGSVKGRGSPYIAKERVVDGGGREALIARMKPHHDVLAKLHAMGEGYIKKFNADPATWSVREREAHVIRHWVAKPGRVTAYASELSQRVKAGHQRFHESRWAGIDAGLKPRYTNYIDDMVAHAGDFARAKAAAHMLPNLRELVKGTPDLIMPAGKAPSNYKRVEHRAFTEVFGKRVGQNRLIVAPDLAKQLQAVLDKKQPVPTTMRAVSALLKANKGKWSAHGKATGGWVEVRDPALRLVPTLTKAPHQVAVHPDLYKPLQGLLARGFEPGALKATLDTMAYLNRVSRQILVVPGLFHPISLIENRLGGPKMRRIFKPSHVARRWAQLSDPKVLGKWAKQGLDLTHTRPSDIVRRGEGVFEKFGRVMEWKAAASGKRWQAALAKGGKALHKVTIPLRLMTRAIFDVIRPVAMYDHAEALKDVFTKKGMGETEAMKLAASQVRNIYGQQQFKWEPNFLAHPKVQALGHAALFSYNWTTGTARQAGMLFPRGKPGTVIGSSTKAGHRAAMAYWAKAALVYGVGMNLINLYNTWKYKGEAKFIWQNPSGRKLAAYAGPDNNGRDFYSQSGKQYHEVLRMVANPLHALFAKASVPVRVAAGVAYGRSPSSPTPFSDIAGYKWGDFPLESKGTREPWGGRKGFAGTFWPKTQYAMKTAGRPFFVGRLAQGVPWLPALTLPTRRGLTPYQARERLSDMYMHYAKTGTMSAYKNWWGKDVREELLKELKSNNIATTPKEIREFDVKVQRSVQSKLRKEAWRELQRSGKFSEGHKAAMKRAGITRASLILSARSKHKLGSLNVTPEVAMQAIRAY